MSTHEIFKGRKLFSEHWNEYHSIFITNCLDVSDCREDDQVCLKEAESLEAIETLHKQIDDDQSGNIDQSESDEVSTDQSEIDEVSTDQSETD